jgi:uncharacterized membrane protein YgaE (UPF0421/DUF939 family)
MFGFGVNKRKMRELERQIIELNSDVKFYRQYQHTHSQQANDDLNRLRAGYMEMLGKLNEIPTVEQTKENLRELLHEGNLAEMIDDMSESSKRRFCSEVLEFISTDGYMRDTFHEKLDEPIRHLMPDIDTEDLCTDTYARDIAWEVAQEVLSEAKSEVESDVRDLENRIEAIEDESEIAAHVEQAVKQARTEALREETTRIIREQVMVWARQLAPTKLTEEEATKRMLDPTMWPTTRWSSTAPKSATTGRNTSGETTTRKCMNRTSRTSVTTSWSTGGSE